MEQTTELTWHGKNRIKQRCGIPKRASERNAQIAFDKGIRHNETTGSLRNYLDGVFLKEGIANNMRVWQSHVYVFRGERLITVLSLPSRFRKTELALMKKKKESVTNTFQSQTISERKEKENNGYGKQ